MAEMVLDTVYPTFAARMQTIGGTADPGSLEIYNGTVDIYFSNNETEPPNTGAMTPDPAGPFDGPVQIQQAARWIAVVANTGSPVVQEFRVAVVE